jgi:hypothetical protein
MNRTKERFLGRRWTCKSPGSPLLRGPNCFTRRTPARGEDLLTAQDLPIMILFTAQSEGDDTKRGLITDPCSRMANEP